MLFMLIIKASPQAEAVKTPNQALRVQMDDYNEALDQAGIKVMAKGLFPVAEAYRLAYTKVGEEPTLSKGPFPHPKEQIAGFFLIDVPSKENALLWLKKCPDPQGFGEGVIELRQVR
jgi:hypothetical protein